MPANEIENDKSNGRIRPKLRLAKGALAMSDLLCG
jgi:hypothetical protein